MKYPRQLQGVLRQLGVPGWLGVALCGMSLFAWLALMPTARSEVDELQQQATRLRERLTREASSSSQPGKTPELPLSKRAQDAWNHWWQALPDRQQAAQLQADVLAAAKAQGVMTQSVQFTGGAVKALPGVWRQQMSMPAEAPYAALRAWLAQLNRQPALSIDSLDISRTDPMSDRVKARVAVSLWWRLPLPEDRKP